MNSVLFRSSASRIIAASSVRPALAAAVWQPLPLVPQQQQQQHQPQCRAKHTVRVILQDDLPNGKAYSGDVLHVAAGYARNYLIPQKKALYATRQNFARLGMKDPDMETAEERQARLARERLESEDYDLKAADLLKNYLRNKVLKIYRTVDPVTEEMRPGMVDAKAIRQKLSKQLKIDLEPHEKVHLRSEGVVHSELTDQGTEEMMKELGDVSQPCTTQVRQLGEYMARVALKGGFMVPLKVEVLKR